jgi:periplasmic protein TonB
MLSQEHLPKHRRHPFYRSRTARTVAAVVLAHAGLIWLLGSGVLNTSATTVVDDNIIMASVVTEVTAVPAPMPSPVVPQVQPKNRPVPQTLTKPAISPVLPAPPSVAPAQSTPVATPALAASVEVASAVVTAPSPASPLTVPSGSPRAGNPAPAAPAAVVLPSGDADYLNNPAPAYPRMSRRMGEQGTVVVRVFISTEGRAEKAEVRTSSGYSRLDEAALDTVQRWRYMPGKRGGVPEAMWFNVPIRFVLD